jgi:uncharacterized protein YndB with AHSA1/START domain
VSTKTSYANGVLTVTRLYDAPRAAVFDAWINSSKVQLWWGCGDTTDCKSRVVPKVGGDYHHDMTLHGKYEHQVHGLITEYDPPSRLAYEVADERMDQTMTVAVDFIEKSGGTEVRLIHAGVPDDFSDIVTGGWTAAFEKLDRFLVADAA